MFRNPRRLSRTLISWSLLWVLLAAGILYPVTTDWLRYGLVIIVSGLFLASLALAWPRRMWRALVLLLGLVLPGIFLLPSGPIDIPSLRAAYVDTLRTYEGTRYVWGGEDERGVDCSGLIRRGMIRACLCNGIASCNGELTRSAFVMWWRDASAKCLGEGYGGCTIAMRSTPSIKALDANELAPGDFAVTADGHHCLAYLGGNQWIQAIPTADKVVIDSPAKDADPYFQTPMKIMRWRLLAE